jgi:hypothetical protein
MMPHQLPFASVYSNELHAANPLLVEDHLPRFRVFRCTSIAVRDAKAVVHAPDESQARQPRIFSI